MRLPCDGVFRRGRRGHAEHAREEVAGMRLRDQRDLLRRAGGNDRAAAVAAFGAEVDDPVSGLDDIEVVLDHDNRVAVVDEALQHAQQLLDVVEVQARGRLVEDVERAAGVALAEFAREFHALRFAARQRRRALAQLDVGEADVHQRFEFAREHGHGLEQLERVFDGHLKHVGDRVALVGDLERLAVVALAVADVAGHVDVGQKCISTLIMPSPSQASQRPPFTLKLKRPGP
jgi:hypothetical protein